MNKKITAVVLAAGKSKRIKASLPKVLLDLGGKPLIFYVLEALTANKNIDRIIVVLGHQEDEVKKAIQSKFKSVRFVRQNKLNGTAKAIEAAKGLFSRNSNVLALCGDAPLIKASTLAEFSKFFFKTQADCAIVTSVFEKKSDLGVVLRDTKGNVKSIVEKTEFFSGPANEEVNSGIYCFKAAYLLEGLKKIRINTKKKEYFLTDLINIFYRRELDIKGFKLKDNTEVLGVNTQGGLCVARKILNRRFLDFLLDKGVMIMDPDTTFVNFDTKIGRNSIVYPFTFIGKNVIIGSNCTIGPFAHLRNNTVIKDDVVVGSFTEVNRTTIGKNVRMKHFGYLGDAFIGDNTNIGAGTVVANYDGKRKHRTVVGNKAFIGSDTVIVAPVKIGKGAITGAGSVVTKNVKQNEVVVGVPAKVLKRKKRKKAA